MRRKLVGIGPVRVKLNGMRVCVRVFLLFCLFVVSLKAFAQGYAIEKFSFEAELHANGSMDVTETIQVLFEESRRGIFRKIPVHYDTGKGTTRDIYLDKIDVRDSEGNSLTTMVESEGRYRSIRIGDEDIFFDPGTRKTYVIKYRADGMINWFDATSDWEPTAELYWGITGEEWDTHMKRVEARVRFPEVEGAKGLRARVFYGPYGATTSQTLLKPARGIFEPLTDTYLSLEENEVQILREETMPAYNGITLVLNLPAHLIAKPTFAQQAYRLIMPNLGFAIPLIVIFAMSIFWFVFGRDPHGGPMAVQFDPPDGIGGAELGALLDERVDQRDLAAGIIGLAVKGHLTMIPKEEGLVFKKRTADLVLTDKKDKSGLTTFEKKLLDRLDNCSNPIDESELRRHVAPHVADLHKTLYSELVSKGYYLTSPESARTAWGCGGVAAIVLLAFAFTAMSPFGSPLPAIVGGIVGAILLFLFARGMPRRTPNGSKALSKAKGFEEFVRRARQDELEWMTQKHPDAALFETYLPHAVAMGLTREWAQAFEGIVKEMPDWYGAPRGTVFHPVYFADDLGSISNSVGNAAAVPPRSSGGGGGSSGFSSGGGFSGGGFGGGGGGSW